MNIYERDFSSLIQCFFILNCRHVSPFRDSLVGTYNPRFPKIPLRLNESVIYTITYIYNTTNPMHLLETRKIKIYSKTLDARARAYLRERVGGDEGYHHPPPAFQIFSIDLLKYTGCFRITVNSNYLVIDCQISISAFIKHFLVS